MKTVILYMLIGLCQTIIAQQTTFEFILSAKESLRPINIKEADDGSIYFVGRSNYSGSNKTEGLVIKIDESGNLIDTLSIVVENRSFQFTQIVPDNNSTLILNGNSSDTTVEGYNSRIELFRINPDLDIIDSNSYFVSENHHVYSTYLNLLKSGNIILSGSMWSNLPPPSLMINFIVSPYFDSLYSYFSQPTGGRGTYYVRQLNDTTLWTLAWLGAFEGFVLTDTLFIQTGERTRTPNSVIGDYGVKWDTDTTFFLSGEWNGGPDDDIGMFRFYDPLDTTNYIFKSWGTLDTLDYPAPYGGIDLNNKDTVFWGGTTNFWLFPGEFPSYYFLLQTDSLLNIRWEKFYGGDANYILHSIDVTRDGGCLLGGIRHDFSYEAGKTDAHVLKVNSQGLITGSSEKPKIEIREAIVFPNPGTNYIKVRIAAQYTNSTFELYDMAGNHVLTKSIVGKWGEIETSFLLSGTFVYRIFNDDGLSETGKWVKQ